MAETLSEETTDRLLTKKFSILGPTVSPDHVNIVFDDGMASVIPWDVLKKLTLQVDLTHGTANDCNCGVCRKAKSGRLKQVLS